MEQTVLDGSGVTVVEWRSEHVTKAQSTEGSVQASNLFKLTERTKSSNPNRRGDLSTSKTLTVKPSQVGTILFFQ